MNKKKINPWTRWTITLLLFVCFGITLNAQSPSKTGINGKVYELGTNGKRTPLGFATVYFPDYGM